MGRSPYHSPSPKSLENHSSDKPSCNTHEHRPTLIKHSRTLMQHSGTQGNARQTLTNARPDTHLRAFAALITAHPLNHSKITVQTDAHATHKNTGKRSSNAHERSSQHTPSCIRSPNHSPSPKSLENQSSDRRSCTTHEHRPTLIKHSRTLMQRTRTQASAGQTLMNARPNTHLRAFAALITANPPNHSKITVQTDAHATHKNTGKRRSNAHERSSQHTPSCIRSPNHSQSPKSLENHSSDRRSCNAQEHRQAQVKRS